MDELTQKLHVLSDLGIWEWPDEGKLLVMQGLASDQAEQRLAALECVGESLDRELMTLSMDLLEKDPEELVRAAAAIALGPALEMMSTEVDDDQGDDDLDPEDAAELPLSVDSYRALEERLQQIALDATQPVEVRRRCLEAAVRSKRSWQGDAVRQAFAQSGIEWRLTAVFCAGFLDGFRGEISEALDHEDPEVRMEAIRAAGECGIEALGPEILDIAKDEEILLPLRLAAIDALVPLAPDGTHEFLEKLAGGEDDLAEMAVLALQDLLVMDPERLESLGLLEDLLANSEDAVEADEEE